MVHNDGHSSWVVLKWNYWICFIHDVSIPLGYNKLLKSAVKSAAFWVLDFHKLTPAFHFQAKKNRIQHLYF